LGQIVEETQTRALFEKPLHPYTQGLIRSIPRLDGERAGALHVIKGTVPSLYHVPEGCRFSTRCGYADDKCKTEEPPMLMEDQSHHVKCWHYEAIRDGKKEESHNA